ncbi:MAG: gephyrin-like molybdotransferase Glp [Pacificimonas sp.]|jgi:molybdopterin molybdotransferase|nr:gephyrin-like molybdotransferase Glp [Pacificimonas sp.]
MLEYEEALARILAGAEPLAAEPIALTDAAGRTLAAPVTAKRDQPPFDASAMDGYAVRWSDLPGPFRLIGESAAGSAFDGKVGKGETVRIFTGAAVPVGADTVVVQEEVAASGGTIEISGDGPPRQGAHIRPCGFDFTAGSALIEAGQRLSPRHLALAAAAGHGELAVHRRPRITLIANGDELVPPGETPAPGQITASSSAVIAAQLRAAGAEVCDAGIIPDDAEALAAALISAADTSDLIITMGGASVGDHDHMHTAMDSAGAQRDFWRIAIRPGKPLIHGQIDKARLLGLPGNPVSAYVCALLFAEPLIRAWQNQASGEQTITMPLAASVDANDRRRDHLRAEIMDGTVRPLSTQDSSQLAILARADALIVRPPHAPAAEPGTAVPVMLLDKAWRAA